MDAVDRAERDPEVQARVAAHRAQALELWTQAVATAMGIAENRGLATTKVWFSIGESDNWSMKIIQDEFSCELSSGGVARCRRDDDEVDEQVEPWDVLNSCLQDLGECLPPSIGGDLTEQELQGLTATHDLILHLYAEVDDEGCFRYDDAGDYKLRV